VIMAQAQLVGQVLDEKYRIEKQLGKGGMGSVYLATHLGTDRPVALKVIAPQFMLNDEFIERFKREAKASGRMRHPNVVDVTDFGFAQVESARVAYLVMEYLDGCTLGEVLAEESRLPIDWVIDILEQTCSAVDEAHKQGVIHRDLKPDNIWLEPNRRGGYTVKVLDFGLAKLADVALSEVPGGDLLTSKPTIILPVSQATKRATAPSAKTLREVEKPALSLTPSRTTSSNHRDTERIEAVTQTPALHEAATQMQAAPVVEEESEKESARNPASELVETIVINDTESVVSNEDDATQLLPPEIQEEAMRLRPQPSGDGRITQGFDHDTMEEQRAKRTITTEGLTLAGSILGTPLYMSPEQCRGEPLDARSDIYSLGIIAYQMLAGDPPFKGQTFDVMKLHVEAPPPPLREKRREIPRRMGALIMSCLAKNPDERPASAAAFASAFRASSEGTGTLMRKAFAIYSEHFPAFFRLSLVTFAPVIALTIILTVVDALKSEMVISLLLGNIITGVIAILVFFANFIASSVIVGVIIRFVTQLYVAPLRPIKVRAGLAALKKKLRPLLLTTFRVGFFSIAGLFLLIIPGAIYFINSSLAAPVVMMENLKGRDAVRRSKSLVKRARGTVIAIILIQYFMPAIASSLVMAALGTSEKIIVKLGQPANTSSRIGSVIGMLLHVFFTPLLSTLTALLYLKVRQIGGETLKEALSEFEEEETPRARWQQRMRERLHTPTHKSR
jgi:serine/threonine protein kinase